MFPRVKDRYKHEVLCYRGLRERESTEIGKLCSHMMERQSTQDLRRWNVSVTFVGLKWLCYVDMSGFGMFFTAEEEVESGGISAPVREALCCTKNFFFFHSHIFYLSLSLFLSKYRSTYILLYPSPDYLSVRVDTCR